MKLDKIGKVLLSVLLLGTFLTKPAYGMMSGASMKVKDNVVNSRPVAVEGQGWVIVPRKEAARRAAAEGQESLALEGFARAAAVSAQKKSDEAFPADRAKRTAKRAVGIGGPSRTEKLTKGWGELFSSGWNGLKWGVGKIYEGFAAEKAAMDAVPWDERGMTAQEFQVLEQSREDLPVREDKVDIGGALGSRVEQDGDASVMSLKNSERQNLNGGVPGAELMDDEAGFDAENFGDQESKAEASAARPNDNDRKYDAESGEPIVESGYIGRVVAARDDSLQLPWQYRLAAKAGEMAPLVKARVAQWAAHTKDAMVGVAQGAGQWVVSDAIPAAISVVDGAREVLRTPGRVKKFFENVGQAAENARELTAAAVQLKRNPALVQGLRQVEDFANGFMGGPADEAAVAGAGEGAARDGEEFDGSLSELQPELQIAAEQGVNQEVNREADRGVAQAAIGADAASAAYQAGQRGREIVAAAGRGISAVAQMVNQGPADGLLDDGQAELPFQRLVRGAREAGAGEFIDRAGRLAGDFEETVRDARVAAGVARGVAGGVGHMLGIPAVEPSQAPAAEDGVGEPDPVRGAEEAVGRGQYGPAQVAGRMQALASGMANELERLAQNVVRTEMHSTHNRYAHIIGAVTIAATLAMCYYAKRTFDSFGGLQGIKTSVFNFLRELMVSIEHDDGFKVKKKKKTAVPASAQASA